MIEDIFGPLVSRNEHEILGEFRRLSSDADPRLATRTQRQALAAFPHPLPAHESRPARPRRPPILIIEFWFFAE